MTRGDAVPQDAPATASTVPARSAPPISTGIVGTPDGVNLYFERAGQGAPLVFVNNFFMNAPHWRPLTGLLRLRNEIVNYDLRHQGQSDRVDAPLSVAQHVDDLHQIISLLDLERPILIGTCISTAIVRDYIIKHPRHVSAIVLVGPIFGKNGALSRKFFHRSLMNTLSAHGAEGLFDHYYPLLYSARTIKRMGVAGYLALKASFVQNNPKEQLAKHLMSTIDFPDPPGGLGNIGCPILVLCGEDDFVIDRDSLRSYARERPNLELQFMEGAGHNPYLEDTCSFEEKLGEFVERVSDE
jgi:pimeloyl-ACP methyl ester carboxylesterase